MHLHTGLRLHVRCCYCIAEDDQELNEEEIVDHPRAAAPVLPVATVAAASACIDRVLSAVYSNLSRLLTEDNLQLHFLEVARHHLAGKDEAAELQVQPPLLLSAFSRNCVLHQHLYGDCTRLNLHSRCSIATY